MKRLAIIFLILLWASPLSAQMLQGCVSAGGAAATCVTAGQSCGGGTDYDSNVNWYYEATPFTASESSTVCSISVTIKKVGTPTGTHKVGIYTNNALGCSGKDCPGTLVGNWSDNYNNADLTTSYQTLNRTKAVGGIGASLTATTKYWVVLYSSLGSFNAAPYPQGNANCGNVVQQSDNGTTWTEATVWAPKFQLYK